MKPKSPVFSNGIMADGYSKGDLNKVNAQGVFTTFWIWGFPAQRRWAIILSIGNLSKGNYQISYFIRKQGNSSVKRIGSGILKNYEGEELAILPVPLTYEFKSDGIFELLCQFKDENEQGIITFEVKKKEWPIFSEEELTFAKTSTAHIIRNLRANIHCKKCSHAYIFEETILPDLKASPGVIRFPADGRYTCKDCGHILFLKDIQGQLRASLKEQLNNVMGGK